MLQHYMQHKQETLLFSKERNESNKNDRYVLFKTVSSFLVIQNDNSMSESFGKISWSLLDTMTASSHSFCQTWCIYLAVKGFRSEKGMRSTVGSFSSASLAALSAASVPCIPTCPGTHIETIFLWSTSIVCHTKYILVCFFVFQLHSDLFWISITEVGVWKKLYLAVG